MTVDTFEKLPAAVEEALRRLENVERLLLNKPETITPDPDRWLDIRELAEYLPDKPAVPTIYGYVHRRAIPYHKNSKKLYFLKSEIDAWLRSGRQLTNTEAEAVAVNLLKRRSR